MRRQAKLLAVPLSLLVLAALSGCGITAARESSVLPLDLHGGEKVTTSMNVASVTIEDDAAYLTAVKVKPWGKFGPDDLTNIEQSLKDTIAPSLTAKSHNVDSQMDLHLVVRKYIVSLSNTAGAVLVCVAWAATTSKGTVIYKEQFYAFDAGYLTTTIGHIKDSVQKAIVQRIAKTSLEIAQDPVTAKKPRKFDKTSSSFEEAVSCLPKTILSMDDPAAMTFSFIGLFIPSGKATIKWEMADLKEAFDWGGYLNKLYGP